MSDAQSCCTHRTDLQVRAQVVDDGDVVHKCGHDGHVMRHDRGQGDDGQQNVHLAIGDFSYDEIAGEDGEVKAVANYLHDARPRRIRHGAEFDGHEDGGHHSQGKYCEQDDSGHVVLRSHAKDAREGKAKHDEEQDSDRVVHNVHRAQDKVPLSPR